MIETIPVAEATQRLRALGMRISPDVLRSGIEQKVFPFGDCVRSKTGSPVSFIYVRLLDEWIKARECEE